MMDIIRARVATTAATRHTCELWQIRITEPEPISVGLFSCCWNFNDDREKTVRTFCRVQQPTLSLRLSIDIIVDWIRAHAHLIILSRDQFVQIV